MSSVGVLAHYEHACESAKETQMHKLAFVWQTVISVPSAAEEPHPVGGWKVEKEPSRTHGHSMVDIPIGHSRCRRQGEGCKSKSVVLQLLLVLSYLCCKPISD